MESANSCIVSARFFFRSFFLLLAGALAADRVVGADDVMLNFPLDRKFVSVSPFYRSTNLIHC